MFTPMHDVGLPVSELDTPALLIDLPAMERNIAAMSHHLAGTGLQLRPHVKLHKATPALARLQMQAGAIGVTCARLSEAEAMAEAGIGSILIAHQIVSQRKMERLAGLARRTDVMVVVDNADNVAALSCIAQANGASLGVLIEVDIGHHRCGVQPFEPALELACIVSAAPGLRFKGLMGYDGHCTLRVAASEREALSLAANRPAGDSRRYIEQAGLPVDIVSASGTFTHAYAAQVEGITEIQAGTYLLMDTAFAEHGVQDFEPALTVLGTVTSRHARPGQGELAIMDVGRKALDIFLGLPLVKSPSGARVISLSQEHGRLNLEGEARSLQVGDPVELWVRDANATVNQFRRFHVVRNGMVEAVWDIPG